MSPDYWRERRRKAKRAGWCGTCCLRPRLRTKKRLLANCAECGERARANAKRSYKRKKEMQA
jgi:hypothetical protein